MSYEVVPYTPELDEQIVTLQTHLWSNDLTRNAAYFRWKYADNPFLDEVLIRIALCDGRAVAMRGLFGAAWEVGGADVPQLLPYADDFVVAPAHRNTGVARRVLQESLADASLRDFPFAVSLSAGPVTFFASLAAGWRAAGSYQQAHRPRSPRSRWQRGLDRLRSPGAPPLFAALDRCIADSTGSLAVSRTARPEAMAELIRRLPWDGRIRHVRDARYLDWRFRNPQHEYRFLYWDDGTLQGYLVLQRYLAASADRERVNIVDWEAVDDRVRADLLDAALKLGDFPRVHIWTVGAAESVRALLQRHGFLVDEERRGVRGHSSGLLVRRLGATPDTDGWLLGERNLLDIADWDLRMLYSMAG